MDQAREARLRLPKVNVEQAGMTTHNLALRGACLFREEYIYLRSRPQHRGVVGPQGDERFRRRSSQSPGRSQVKAPEADYRVPWRHVTLKLVELGASMHR
jgi:hypothetical protein